MTILFSKLDQVKTVSYSVMVNGKPYRRIFPIREIRQRDPLSPFLFLLCMEGLNGLIKKTDLQGDIHCYSLCRRSRKLTHLFFADDSLIFLQGNNGGVQKCLGDTKRV